jgi:ATP-dependent RNA helicase DeaD
MLRAIEKATGQTIERMQLPSSENVTDKRVTQFKQQILDVVEAQNLEFYHDVVTQIMEEQNLGAGQIAAALTWLVQKERPLKAVERKLPVEKPERGERKKTAGDKRDKFEKHDRFEKRDKADKRPKKIIHPEQPPRLKNHPDVEMRRYRIEVGKNQEALPKDIVGAIANEAGIDSQYIGQIKLYDNYSTVDLPDGMPKETFQHLKRVRVREHKLDISVASVSDGAGDSAGPGKKPGNDKHKPGKDRHRKADRSKRA